MAPVAAPNAEEKPKRLRPRLSQVEKDLRHQKRVALNDELQRATSTLQEQAREISKRHNKNLTWTARALYLGGKMLRNKRSASAWNAFVQKEINRANQELPKGSRYKLTAFMAKFHGHLRSKFLKLSSDERKALQTELAVVRNERATSHRISAIGMQRDVDATFQSMDLEWNGVCERTGVGGFYMAVRGDIEHFHQPKLFFSKKARDFFKESLDLDPDRVALQFEAWVVGNIKKGPTNKRSVTQEISECRMIIQEGLSAVLEEKGVEENVAMNYENYERKIAVTWGVVLKGWPGGRIVNPGKLGARQRVQDLLDALRCKRCVWVTLTEEELAACIADNKAREEAGEVVYKPRKAAVSKSKATVIEMVDENM